MERVPHLWLSPGPIPHKLPESIILSKQDGGGEELRLRPWLRTPGSLTEDPDLLPSTHMVSHKPSATPLPGDPTLSSDFHRHRTLRRCMYIHTDQTFIHMG